MSQPFRDSTNRVATPTSSMMKSMAELSISKTPGSASRRANLSNLFNNTGKTPNSSVHGSQSFCGRGNNGKVQLKGLRRRELTPSRNMNFSGVGGGDRFIPNRSASQFDLGNYMLSAQNQGEDVLNTSQSAPSSPRRDSSKNEAFKKMMRVKSANDLADEDDRILVYRKSGAPAPPVGHSNQAKVLYSASYAQPSSSVKKSSRHIPSAPDKLLDAPDYQDDYYANLVDWGSVGLVAVGLLYTLYLWNSENGEIQELFSLDEDGDNLIKSVRWSSDGGRFLAVGFANGVVRLYDPCRGSSELRKLTVPWMSKAGCLAWRSHVLSVGHKSGQILHHDVRVSQHHVGTWNGHSFEVCGLEWNETGSHCASGGGDNIVNVWDGGVVGSDPLAEQGPDPLLRFTEHISSVKAIQFCPYKAACLASGGGTTDRTVKLWDLTRGTLSQSINTGSQVTGIRFNSVYKEMVTSHGNPGNVLKIWKHPSYDEIATLAGHTERVLGLSSSPCGEYVLSASGDETIRIWRCFKVDVTTKRIQHRSKMTMGLAMR